MQPTQLHWLPVLANNVATPDLQRKAPFTRYNLLSNRIDNWLYRVYSRLSNWLYNLV